MTVDRPGNRLVPIYLGLCLLLGGGSAAALWANVLLQVLAVPILFWAFSRQGMALSGPGRQLVALLSIGLLIPVVQLVPLSPAVWTGLPGREGVAAGFNLLGQPLPWLPISLAPYGTIAAVLWLLPAFAILLALLRRGVASPAALAATIIGIMVLSVLVGALQITGGRDSFWYFYDITNYGVTVGFFANANHMATLLIATLPFLCASYASMAREGRSPRNPGPRLIMLVGAGLLVAVGLVINGSLAGVGLMVPVALASIMLLRKQKPPRWILPVLAIITIASTVVVMSGWFDNNLLGQAAYTSSLSRYTAYKTSLAAALDYFPFGSGLGTFASIYRTYENPEQVTSTYMNHAHSDYIELFLETGVLGVLLIGLFLWWWLRQTITIWRSKEREPYARAATIASAAILAHSFVDYPLRTVAIASILAVCCALMASPKVLSGRSTAASNARAARHLSAD